MITVSEEVETLNFIFHITFPFREVTKTGIELGMKSMELGSNKN